MSLVGEEEGKEEILSSVIEEMCAKLGKLQLFIEKSFPSTVIGNRSLNIKFFKDVTPELATPVVLIEENSWILLRLTKCFLSLVFLFNSLWTIS